MKNIIKYLFGQFLAHPSWAGAGVITTILLAIIQFTPVGNKLDTSVLNAWYVGDWRIDTHRTIDNLEGDIKELYLSSSQDDIVKFVNNVLSGHLNTKDYPGSLGNDFDKKKFIAWVIGNMNVRFTFKNSELYIKSDMSDFNRYHSNVDGIKGDSEFAFRRGSGYASIQEITDDTAILKGKTTEEFLDCNGMLIREEREQTATIKKLNQALAITTNAYLNTNECSPENGHRSTMSRPVLRLFLKKY